MKMWAKIALGALGTAAAWEGAWWVHRRHMRGVMFHQAQARARELGRPLVVIGAPDAMVTAGYPCGDVTVDILPSACPNSIQADITQPLPFEDNSVVVFVSCTLEYVDDNIDAVVTELNRISGGELWVKRVEPWTLTSFLFPGTKRRLLRPLPIRHLAGG